MNTYHWLCKVWIRSGWHTTTEHANCTVPKYFLGLFMKQIISLTWLEHQWKQYWFLFSYQIQKWQSWQPNKTPQSPSSWMEALSENQNKKKNSQYCRSWIKDREITLWKEKRNKTFAHTSTLNQPFLVKSFFIKKKQLQFLLYMILFSPSLSYILLNENKDWDVKFVVISNN